VLDKHGTDALLLYPDPDMATLMGFLDDLPDWIPVLHWNNWVLYLRKGSRPLKELIAKEREGTGWRPPTLALVQEGQVDHPAPSVLYQRTLYFYQRAIQREPVLALRRLEVMCDAWIALGRADRGRAFLSEQRDLLKAHNFPGYDDHSKEVLMGLIDRCDKRLRLAQGGQENSSTYGKP